jgi:hypothetical protein
MAVETAYRRIGEHMRDFQQKSRGEPGFFMIWR